MYHKTFYHSLSSGEKAKFTIRARIIGGKTFYYAKVINTELDVYKSLTDHEKEAFDGTEITDGEQGAINYRDPERLARDIITKYGIERLETEE